MDAARTWILKRVAVATLVSIFGSVAITLTIHYMHAGAIEYGVGLLIAVLAPAVIAPVGSYQYISLSHRLRVANEQLRVLSEIDSLTGVLNRRRFLELGAQQLSLAARHRYPTSLLVLDFDHFKQINDRLGHAIGDVVLVRSIESVGKVIRETDLLGRIGGEEFALLLPHTARQGAIFLADRIVATIRNAVVPLAEGSIRVTVSVGGAASETSQAPLEQLLHRADEQLYLAKQAGRDRFAIEPESAAPFALISAASS